MSGRLGQKYLITEIFYRISGNYAEAIRENGVIISTTNQ